MSSSNKTKKMYVVSHTHWDREWYQDFQAYRTRLVYMMDELIDKMENDAEYRYFNLDGQTIMVDDYLEIRPENKERLLALIQQGRIYLGPWYVMPDEFLVSGESLIRNLLIGHRRSRSFGVEPMKSGYVTDIFGHNSQFPQILQGFSIDNAVLFRGFKGNGDPSEIWWDGVDGSRVLGLKLDEDRAYGDFYFFLRWPFLERDSVYDAAELIERAQVMLEYKAERSTTDIVLGMDGVDHVEIEPQLPWMLKVLNASEKLGVSFEHTTLENYIHDLRERISNLKVYSGEQLTIGYDGVNGWTPRNVLSSRIHLKQHNHHCESLLAKWVEPWAVFSSIEGRPYPKTFIQKAWETLIQNHPHDSICGCSIDQVHQDMMYRFDQSRLISEQMLKEQLDYIVDHLQMESLQGHPSFVVFNPAQTAVKGIINVEISLPANSDAAVKMKHLGGTSFRLMDSEYREIKYQLLAVNRERVQKSRRFRDVPSAGTVDRFRIAFHADIPSYGYTTYMLHSYDIEFPGFGEYYGANWVAPVRTSGTMQINEDTWDNGAVRIRIRPNGVMDIENHETGKCYSGLLLLEDEADIGDGWTHIAPVTNEIVKSIGNSAVISVVHDGPYLTCIRVRLELSLPRAIQAGETQRSEEHVKVPVTTEIELRKADPVIHCRTIIHNTARDHRLKMLFPTGLQTDVYHASTPFDLVERNIIQSDYTGYIEKAPGIMPFNGIVSLHDGHDGLAVYSKGLYEVAVREDEPRTIALTLFRSTNKEVFSDGSDAGQMLREMEFSYAIHPYSPSNNFQAVLWNNFQKFDAGIRTVNRKSGRVFHETPYRREANLPLTQSYFSVSTRELVVSAIKEAEDCPGEIIIRLWNVADNEVTGELSFGQQVKTARLINLDEQPLSELSASGQQVTLQVKSKQIVTVNVQFQLSHANHH